MKYWSVLLLLLSLALAACGSSPESPAPASMIGQPDPSGPLREYRLEGVVMNVDRNGKSALIDHQEIEGLMGAMTMRFPVADAAELDRIEEGYRISATLYQRPSDSVYWIGDIEVLDGAAAP